MAQAVDEMIAILFGAPELSNPLWSQVLSRRYWSQTIIAYLISISQKSEYVRKNVCHSCLYSVSCVFRCIHWIWSLSKFWIYFTYFSYYYILHIDGCCSGWKQNVSKHLWICQNFNFRNSLKSSKHSSRFVTVNYMVDRFPRPFYYRFLLPIIINLLFFISLISSRVPR